MVENKEFFIENEGRKIHCKLEFPLTMKREEDKCPLMIWVPGFTGHIEEPHMVGIAAHVVSLGYAVLRVELYGHGKSEGEFKNHTIIKWIDQMLAVMDYAVKLPFVTDLYLAGHSQAGLMTILVGAMEQDRVKAILPMSPAIVIKDAGNAGEIFGRRFDSYNIPEKIDLWDGRELGGNYFRVSKFLPIEECIRSFEKPVLLVHGDEDEAVPVKYAYEAAKLYKNCTLRIIEGDDHCYGRHLDKACAAVEEFLKTV